MSDQKALVYVELDIDYCSLTYGTAPCAASIPTTGARKCFNSLGTCQDRVNFANSPVTFRFGKDTGYLPDAIECIPCLKDVNINPSVVSLGKSLGERATVTMAFSDHKHSDTGVGFDKYRTERGYDAYNQGSFFGRFKARHPYLRGRNARVITGYVGQTLAEMKTQHFIIDSFSGPDSRGNYTITCKDILKLLDDDIAKAPALSNGYVADNIAAAATKLVLEPTGVGAAEYPLNGYVAIGGEEICSFRREPGIADSHCVLALLGDGTNLSATITDSSPKAHVFTAGGNVVNSTTLSKFGTGSLFFDGTGDYILGNGSSDFAFGTGDFTIEFWVYMTALGTARFLWDGRPAGVGGTFPTIYVTNANVMRYHTNNADRISGVTALTINTWHHIAVSRVAGTTRMFLNGSQQGSNYVDATNYTNPASRPVIGADGSALGSSSLQGRMDEIRVLKGFGLYESNFTVPAISFTAAASTDILHLIRARYETTAKDHQADDRVQLCLQYSSKDPADIFYDLMTNYADVDPSYLPLAAWKTETSNYLQRVYTTLIAEPTGVNALLSELAEQAALAVWWDEINRNVRLQVLREIPTTAYTYDESIVLQGTFSAKEQPNTRLSEVWTFFGQRNPLLKLDEKKNYRSAIATSDLQAETDYGTPQIRQIFSRWIPAFGRTIAERLNNITLGRFRDPPRRISYELMPGNDGGIVLGGGYQIKHWSMQDDTGAQASVPIQVTRLHSRPEKISVEAEEMLFRQYGTTDDPNLHIIIIDNNTTNFNLRTVHDTLYAPISDPTGITVRCVVEAGVTVGSTSNTTPALDVGSWPASLAIEIEILGRVQGKGGNAGTISGTTATAGQDGGTALYTRYPVSVKVASGDIWGGGGGGGASKHTLTAPGNYIAGGGGGAGYFGGSGGLTVGGTSGASGSQTAGGAGGTVTGVQKGGNGGGPGLAGQAGQHSPAIQNGAGGAAGSAIDGVSYVTFATGPGDRRGAEVN